MKAIIIWLFFISLMYSSSSFAQEIPNHSFEDWVIGAPVGWFGFGISQSSDAIHGNFSARIDVLDDGTVPLLIAGDVVPGINVSERYGTFKGNYKLNPNGNDFLKVDVIMGFSGEVVGIGSAQFQGTQDFWTSFTIPITYSSELTPNDALIFFSISNEEGSAAPGSDALIDLVSFDEITDVEGVDANSESDLNLRNFPNPFDLLTTISFDMKTYSRVSLEIYNLTGKKVYTLLKNEMINKGHHEFHFDSMDLSSGLYFYTLTTDNYTVTCKMNCIK